jgi:hypothetical protein
VKKGPTAETSNPTKITNPAEITDPTKLIDPTKMTNTIDAKDLSRIITAQR